MNGHDPIPRLRIGMIGSGFIANFHLQALVSVRHVTVAGIYSPNAAHREALAAKANALELGPCRAFPTLETMLISGEGLENFSAHNDEIRSNYLWSICDLAERSLQLLSQLRAVDAALTPD